MPNTLVHFAAQGAASHALWRRLDPRFLYLGCGCPTCRGSCAERPWPSACPVGRLRPAAVHDGARLAGGHAPPGRRIAVRDERRRGASIAWLGLNALLHLLLDATEIKFGNGVHLLAPLSWRMTSFDLLPAIRRPPAADARRRRARPLGHRAPARRGRRVGAPPPPSGDRRPARRRVPRGAAPVPGRDPGQGQLLREDARGSGVARRPPRRPGPGALRRDPGGGHPRALDRRSGCGPPGRCRTTT